MLNTEKLIKDYDEKTYIDRNIKLYKTAKVSSIVFQCICVLFGFLGVFIFINNLLPVSIKNDTKQYIAVLLAFWGLVGLEYTKRLLIQESCKRFYIYKKYYIGTTVFAFLITLFSIAISKNGAKTYYEKYNAQTKVTLLSEEEETKTKRQELEGYKNDTSTILKRYVWDDTKTLTSEGRKAFLLASENINRVQKQIDSLVQKVRTENKKRADNEADKITKTADTLSWFVVIIDLLIIATLFYPVRFEYKASQELRDTLQDSKNDEKTQKIDKKKQKENPYPMREGGDTLKIEEVGQNLESGQKQADKTKNKADKKRTKSGQKADNSTHNGQKSGQKKTQNFLEKSSVQFQRMSADNLRQKQQNLERSVRRWDRQSSEKNRLKIDQYLDLISLIKSELESRRVSK